MVDFKKVFGKGRESEDKNKPKIVLYKSKYEAEADTGYFSIGSLFVTAALADKIRRYILSNGLLTYNRENKRKTSDNYYTLNFTLKLYYKDAYRDNSTKYGYIDCVGHAGNLKHLLKGNSFRRLDEFGEAESFHYPPPPENVTKYDAVKEKTPEFIQLYFWICQKYPSEIINMSYSKIRPSYLNNLHIDEACDFSYGDEFD